MEVMIMKDTQIDFHRILQAIDGSIQAISTDQMEDSDALKKLQSAQQEIRHALSYSLSKIN